MAETFVLRLSAKSLGKADYPEIDIAEHQLAELSPGSQKQGGPRKVDIKQSIAVIDNVTNRVAIDNAKALLIVNNIVVAA